MYKEPLKKKICYPLSPNVWGWHCTVTPDSMHSSLKMNVCVGGGVGCCCVRQAPLKIFFSDRLGVLLLHYWSAVQVSLFLQNLSLVPFLCSNYSLQPWLVSYSLDHYTHLLLDGATAVHYSYSISLHTTTECYCTSWAFPYIGSYLFLLGCQCWSDDFLHQPTHSKFPPGLPFNTLSSLHPLGLPLPLRNYF